MRVAILSQKEQGNMLCLASVPSMVSHNKLLRLCRHCSGRLLLGAYTRA